MSEEKTEKEIEERYEPTKYENYEPTEEEHRLLKLINDPRNVVTVNESGERDLSFMKQELSKPENAAWLEQEGWDSAMRLSRSKHISPQQFGNFIAAGFQLRHETKFGEKSSMFR